MATLSRPHPNCYWVEPGRLLAGEYPGAHDTPGARRKLGALLDAGLTYFLDLTDPADPLLPYAPLLFEEAGARGLSATYTRLSIPDMGVPAAPAQMRHILEALDQAQALGRNRGPDLRCLGDPLDEPLGLVAFEDPRPEPVDEF